MRQKCEMVACPDCGKIGDIDDEQLSGQVSIVCVRCGFHWKQKDGKVFQIIGRVPVEALARYEDART